MSSTNTFETLSIDKNASTDSFFFHDSSFIGRNQANKPICFSYSKNNELLAKIYFSISKNVAISLTKSPFGSIDLNTKASDPELGQFIAKITQNLNKRAVNKIIIVGYPEIYDPIKFKRIEMAYRHNNFDMAYEDITHYLDLSQNFVDGLQKTEKRYLNYALKHNFRFAKLSFEYLRECYELITMSREHKGYPITMTFEDLQTTMQRFPNQYLIFGLFCESQLVATSICIKVNHRILYNFYNGDHLDFRKHSPVVALMAHICTTAKTEGYSILDLGISTEKGIINKGLYNFKENLGSSASSKPIYELELSSLP